MQDPNDPGTEDWVDQTSALKNESGQLQVPLKAENLLKCLAIHCIAQGRDPVELVEEIHDATCFWLQDHDMRTRPNPVVTYIKGVH